MMATTSPTGGLLGCPSSYTVKLQYRCGARPYVTHSLDAGVTSVQWSRALSEPGECTVTIAKPQLVPECCDALGKAWTIRLEVALYRDGDVVWYGPLIRREETRSEFVLYAQDMSWWLTKIANIINPLGRTDVRNPGPIGIIARDLLVYALNDPDPVCQGWPSQHCPKDWPCLIPYLYVEDGFRTITFSMGEDGLGYLAYMDAVWQELAKYGMEWTSLGRSIMILKPRGDGDPPRARITDDLIDGDIKIIENAANAATHCTAWAQITEGEGQEQRKFIRCYTVRVADCCQPDGTPKGCQPYGRVDAIVHLTNDKATDNELRAAALTGLGGRYPAPISINLPQGTRLSPRFPVEINRLIPGERYDVTLSQQCQPLAQGFRLTEVTVEWDGSEEKVAIGLAPLHKTAQMSVTL